MIYSISRCELCYTLSVIHYAVFLKKRHHSTYKTLVWFGFFPPLLFTLLLGFPEQSHMFVVKIDFYHRLNTVIGPQSKEPYLPVPAMSYLLAAFMD